MKESTKEYLLAGATIVSAVGKAIITGGHSAASDYYNGQRFKEHWENAQSAHRTEKELKNSR